MVLTSGAFDGLHSGHIRYLHAAKSLCEQDEVLVCAVAPDSYIHTAKRRKARWTQANRIETLNAVMVVDAAIAQSSDSVAGLIRHYIPRLFVKGPDWKNRIPEDVYRACEDVGTSIAFVETEGTHVSETRTSDEDALARFEALVLSQKTPETPWQPVTPFDFESRKAIEGSHPALIWQHLIKCDDADVLDYGCGPDGILVRLLDECRSQFPAHSEMTCFRGYDPQAKKRSGLTRSEPESRAIWDLVICREVLEHCTVREIRRVVTKLCALSAGFVYVTTRFAKEPDSLLSVDTQDGLDPTHISCTNQIWLRHLFVLEGFKRRADLEAAMDWKKLGRVLVYERA